MAKHLWPLIILLGATAAGAQPPPPPSFRTEATVVTVDVVARDRRGNPVTDLRPDEFVLLEDGVPQAIRDVTLVMPAAEGSTAGSPLSSAGNAPAAGRESPAIGAEQGVTALVFDRLAPEARAFASKAALECLDGFGPRDYVGVFLVDSALVTIQPFTTDPDLLREAVREVSTHATTTPRDRLRIGPTGGRDRDPATPVTASADSPGAEAVAQADPSRTRTVDPASVSAMSLEAMARRMERSFEQLTRDQQGQATTNGLLAIVQALSPLRGRKSVILFAESLAIPPNVQAQFESVVATANRGNVAIYSVDAAGLRVHSGQRETAQLVNSLGAEALQRDPDNPTIKLTESLELNEDNLRRDPGVGLGLLSSRTGGFLIQNTNDLARGVRTIHADRRFHYLLSYEPADQDFRGEWRKLEIEVRRRGVEIRSRAGYLAVRSSKTSPLLTREAPLLAALDRNPPPTDVGLRARAFVFPRGPADASVMFLAAPDLSGLEFDTTDADTWRTNFLVLARVQDGHGAVVYQSSQPYALSGPRSALDTARRGEVLFFRQAVLSAGRYSFQVATHDERAGKTGTHSMALTVPDAAPDGVLISSLVLVRRAERIAGSSVEANPLAVNGLQLYPNLGEPLRTSDTATFFVVITLPEGTTARPAAALRVLRQDREILTLPVTLDPPQPDGRILQVVQLPLGTAVGMAGLKSGPTSGTAGLKSGPTSGPTSPGEYVVQLVVEANGVRETRETPLTVVGP